MSQLQMSPDEMRGKANEVENLRQNDIEIMRKLRILVMGLSDSWTGDSQTAFVNKFVESQQTMNNFFQTLEDYINLLNDAASEGETADSDLNDRAQRIGI